MHTTTPSTAMHLALRTILLGALLLALGACSGRATHPDAWRLEKNGLAVELLPTVDRYTYFGPDDGPNLLHVKRKRLRAGPADDDAYTFFGGAYTWTSPQNAWFDESGQPRNWPPDPAMDRGPVRRTGGARGEFEVTGPVHRSGLREIKRFRIESASTARYTYTLQNDGPAPVSAGTWTNLAVRRGSEIALRLTPGTDVWGWNDESIEGFEKIKRTTDPDTGWTIIRPWKARWKGGLKIYIAPPPGDPIEVAICHKGLWLHRRTPGISAEQLHALRAAGEGPIALYIQPGRAKREETIIEAEIYGPLERLAPGQSTSTEETWRVIRAKGKAARVLP